MATRYKGSILSSTAQTPTPSSSKGIWKNATVLQAIKAGLWPTLIPPVEYLVIAGGGPGGGAGNNGAAGGGGAGGLLTGFTSVLTGVYSVTVGGGGAGVSLVVSE